MLKVFFLSIKELYFSFFSLKMIQTTFMKITLFCLQSSNAVNTEYSEKDYDDKEDYKANRDDDDPVLPGEWLVKHGCQNCNGEF